MKKLKTTFFLIFASLIYLSPLNAQYVNNVFELENDSLECLQNISVYKEFQKLKFYDKAIPAWEKTYKSCKGFKKIIYQDGVKFLVYSIKKENDVEKRGLLVDSLMHIYNERIRFFGQEGYVKGRQGIDLLRYGKNRLEDAYAMLKRSFELQKNNTESSVIVTLMTTAEVLFQKGLMKKEIVVETYLKCIEVLEYKLNKEKTADKIQKLDNLIEVVDDIFGKSKAADCKSLVAVFGDKFNEQIDNPEQVLKIQAILKGGGCVNEELYFNVSLQVLKLRPTAAHAELVAGLYLKKEKYEESINYLKQAIELEKNDSLKASYFHDIGFIYCHKLKQYSKARNNAYEAIKLRPDWGNPYILIGDAYAASSASFGGNAFENASVFWAAVDKYYKAKSVDPEVEKLANQKIAYYSSFFPKSENAFMYGYTNGKSYTVGGWINESTTVRTRK